MHEPRSAAIGNFHTSSFSGGGNCVEVGRLSDGGFVVRDTKDPLRKIALRFTPEEWLVFVQAVKRGELDSLVQGEVLSPRRPPAPD